MSPTASSSSGRVGWDVNTHLVCHLTVLRTGLAISEPYLSGKYFDMPKGMKSAPPQQSSLQEMWNGTKKAKAPTAAKIDAVKPEPTVDAGVDGKDKAEDEANAGMSFSILYQPPMWLTNSAVPNGKRKQSSLLKEGL